MSQLIAIQIAISRNLCVFVFSSHRMWKVVLSKNIFCSHDGFWLIDVVNHTLGLSEIAQISKKVTAMTLTAKDAAALREIIALAEKLLANGSGSAAKKTKSARANSRNAQTKNGKKRVRRAGKELVSFRRLLKAERKRGIPVAKIARTHGVTASYIYMI